MTREQLPRQSTSRSDAAAADILVAGGGAVSRGKPGHLENEPPPVRRPLQNLADEGIASGSGPVPKSRLFGPAATSSAKRPVLLDFFCCSGGAGKGYDAAGFRVIGIDIEPQPNYPYEFHQEDALDILESMAAGFRRWTPTGGPLLRLDNVAGIHASPPCQAYSPLNAYNHKTYPDLVDPVRELLERIGLPYVIENVPPAPLRDPVTLCGSMFGLRVYRHRAFETSFPLAAPAHPQHVARCVRNGYLPADDQFMSIHGGKHSKAWREKAADVLGVPWTTTIREVCEAIPPAYTAWIGEQMLDHISGRLDVAA